MTYMFVGAFCEYAESRRHALIRAFPDGVVGVFRRSDPREPWHPAPVWCPAGGLLAVCLPTKYTVDEALHTEEDQEETHGAFFERLRERLPELSVPCPFVALNLWCHGGPGWLDACTFRDGVLGSCRSFSATESDAGLIETLGTIGCELDASGSFPPLARLAFGKFGRSK